MSEYVHTGRRSKLLSESASSECRLMFGVCYALFLVRAVITRLMPWRKDSFFRRSGSHESVFGEAHNAASVLVTSSFMGL